MNVGCRDWVLRFRVKGLEERQAARPLGAPGRMSIPVHRKVDVRLPGKGNSNCRGARPVHLIITMIKWIRASRLSIKNSLYIPVRVSSVSVLQVWGVGGRV